MQQYPGRYSVWILDGASIHCDKYITYFLRSLGIYTIFLPAYCPFFNPIEIIFGNMKSTRRSYVENGTLKQMKAFAAKIATTFMEITEIYLRSVDILRVVYLIYQWHFSEYSQFWSLYVSA